MIEQDDFQQDLDSWAKEFNNGEKIHIKVPKSYEFWKEDYDQIWDKMQEVGIRMPVILKGGLANNHEMFIVKDSTTLTEVCEKMHMEGYSIIVQELVPHDAIEYKIYTFAGTLDC